MTPRKALVDRVRVSTGQQPDMWDLACSEVPPPGTRVFRSERTVLVWPGWAASIEGAYARLRTHWTATRPTVLQGQYSLPSPFQGYRDLIPRRWSSAINVLVTMTDVLSPVPVTFGSGWRIPVWEFDIITHQLRRGELCLVNDFVEPTHSNQEDPLRLSGLDGLPFATDVLVNPVCGMVSASADQHLSWETMAPVAGQTPLWDGLRVRPLTWSGQSSSYTRSRRIAMLESIERLMGARQHIGDTVLATQADLAASGREHRSPEDFGAYDPAAYEGGIVPFSSHDLHEWVEAQSLRDGRLVLVPRDLAFFGQPLATPRWAMVCSSGVATGSTQEEAQVFGLMELIERDVFVNSWYARVVGTRIKVDSVSGLRPLLRRARLLGHEIELVNLRSETRLPVMVAIARNSVVAAFGAAAHPDPARAAQAAVEEAWTYLPERIRAIETDRFRCLALRHNPDLVRGIDDHPLQCVLPEAVDDLDIYLSGSPPVTLQDALVPTPMSAMGATELLSTLVQSLGQIGVEPLAVRCTAPSEAALGLETWSVLAPGLAPLDFGWHRQRVLTMRRPYDYCRNLGLPEPRSLLQRPHPFS